jgi:hypothetical protein
MQIFTFSTRLVTVVVILTSATGADPLLLTKGTHQHDPINIRERHGTNVTSGNWSGYAVTATKGSVTDVKASWVVPAVVGNCPSTDQYASFWVGIDGYSSNTVEQIGTDSDCQNGQAVYYAWFEFYPHGSYNINSLTIKPGDTISAEVSSGSKGAFTVKLTDVTTGQTFSTSTKVPSAAQSSAEWIAEAPSGGGVAPLADFGQVNFGVDHTGVAATCDATIGKASGAIGSFANVDAITMVSKNGATEASQSALSKDGSSFSVSWASN